jgi:hypothetical protein
MQKCNEVMSNDFDGLVLQGAPANNAAPQVRYTERAGTDRHRRHFPGRRRGETRAGGGGRVSLTRNAVNAAEFVMPGSGHPHPSATTRKTWMAGTSPAMTKILASNSPPSASARRSEHARKFIHQHHQLTGRIGLPVVLSPRPTASERRLFAITSSSTPRGSVKLASAVAAWRPQYRSARSSPGQNKRLAGIGKFQFSTMCLPSALGPLSRTPSTSHNCSVRSAASVSRGIGERSGAWHALPRFCAPNR